MKIEIEMSLKGFMGDMLDIENQSIKVGVFDAGFMNTPKKPNQYKYLARNAKIKALKTKSKSNKSTYAEVLPILDKKYGWIDRAKSDFNNLQSKRTRKALVDFFIKGNKTAKDIRKAQNAAVAVLTRPIINSELGTNKASTIKSKGFNMPLVRTGGTLQNITAKYNGGRNGR